MKRCLRGLAPAPVLLLAACGGAAELDVQKLAEAGPPRVVVAVVDTAMNPYHEFFYAGSDIYKDAAPAAVTPEVLAEIGVTEDRVVTLTRTGNLNKDKQADAAFWGKIRRGRPYWFRGTNLIGVSFCDTHPMLIPDPAKNTHGVGTSAAVLRANPEAVVLFVEFCEAIGSDASHDYAFYHPAVDILSNSYGYAAPPLATPPLPLPVSWSGTYDAVVNLGKLQFQAAGNGPGFTPGTGGPGNWWGIGVSGFEEYSANGQTALSGNVADFVSDYTQELPYCQDCERGLNPGVGGTSFSTPRAAGVASRVLLEARRALGHGGGIRLRDGRGLMAEGAGLAITNWDLRRALEEAAYAGYAPTDYAPGAAAPIIDVAPWVQLGWGDLTADPEKGVVAEALAHLGLGTPARFKGPDFCEYQAGWMRFRQSYWDGVAAAVGNGESVPAENPYRFCDSVLPI